MSVEKRVEATAKNIEGKVQEAVGNLSGDVRTQVEGQAKQDDAAAMHAIEDAKDAVKDVIDRV